LSALPSALQPAFAALPDLDARLFALVDAARAAVSDVDIDPAIFAAHLAARLDPTGSTDQLEALRPEDLWLACACERGDAAALLAFDRRFGRDIDLAIARAGRDRFREDMRQAVRAKLFVATAEAPAKIAAYGGKGALRSWVRVTAVRTMLDLVRKKDDPADAARADEALLGVLPTRDPDPELDYIRHAHADRIPVALRTAFLSLTPRQRNILRQRFLHGLSADQLATLYGVHRATAFRWLELARESLMARMRTQLMTELQLSGRALDSLIADLGSRLDVSVRGVIDPALETDGG